MTFAVFVIFFLLSLWFALAVHEAGHLVAAFLVGIPVRLFVVGRGPLLLRFRWRTVLFEFRLFPTAGAVMSYPLLINRKFSSMIFVVSGVLFNIALLLLFTKSGIEDNLFLLTPDADGAVFLGLLLPFAVLIPQKVKLYRRELSSDALHLIELLKSRDGANTPAGEFFMSQLKKFSSAADVTSLQSPSASKVLYLLYRLTTDTQKSDLEISEAELENLIASGMLPPLEEALVLGYLIGYATMTGDDALLGKAPKWLERALWIAPDAVTLQQTRGTVLAATGRYQEAKEVLLPFTSDTCDQGDRLGAYLFLAHSENHLGNKDAAARWLLKARGMLEGVTPSGFFKKRFLALEAEILAEEGSAKIA